VADGSNPAVADQISAAYDVLEEIGIQRKDTLLVVNKIDALEDRGVLNALMKRYPGAVAVSARTGEGLERLDALVRQALDARSALLLVRLPLADGRLAALVRRHGVVQEEEVVGDTELVLRVRMDEGALGNLLRESSGSLRYEVLEPARQVRLEER